jgi:hypothetical protein
MRAISSPAGQCPVLSYSPHERRPIGQWAEFFDQLRADAPVVRNTFGDGYYVLTRYEDILGAYQDPESAGRRQGAELATSAGLPGPAD